MSRTVADATRFTATSPHAYSRPSPLLRSANTISPSSYSDSGSSHTSRRPPPSPNSPSPKPPIPPQSETPQQKVARLRALRAAEKLKPLSLWDRTVVRGRRWADVAHRTIALGLMGLTVIAGVITAFSLTDMLLYNRNQRTLFYATQTAIYTQTLHRAIAAQQSGRPLTDEETQVLNREKAVLKAEAEAEKRKSLPWTERVFGSGGSGAVEVGAMEGEKGKGEGEGVMVGLADAVKEEGVSGVVKPVGELLGQGRVMQALREKRREGEELVEEMRAAGEPMDQRAVAGEQPVGGPLDRVAEEAVEKGKGGWGGWFGGGR